jgi:hypothetical protein
MSINATKRVLWKDVEIGDYAYVTFEYQGNNEVRIIADAKGAKIRGTNELGGGVLNIVVNALVAKDSRFALESYFNDMDTNFSLTAPGTLKISDENGTLTLTSCYLDGFTQSSEDYTINSFTLKFVKSL